MTSLEEQVGGSQNVLGGPFGSKLTQKDYTETGVPVIRGSNMVTGERWLGGEFAYVSEAKVEADLKRNLAQPGDIIVTQRGTLGQVAIAPDRHGFDRYVISQSQMAVRVPKDMAHRDFVFYFLKSPQFAAYVYTSTIQTGVPHINLGILRSAPATWPEREQQEQIASVLAALDDKIELNRRMNETLEAMARALFKDWFVDFGPTRAKIEGRDPYLAPEIWDLFPDKLDEDGKPEGWEVSEIGQEVDAVGGATPSTKEPAYWEEGEQHWVTPKDLSKLSSPVLLDTDRKITDAGVKNITSGLLPIGTVLLSSRAPIGYLAIAEVPTAVNQGFIALVCKKRLPNVYVLFWCYENLDYIKGISGGSTFAEISKKAFRPVPVTIPSEEVLTAYENIVRTLYDRIVVNTKESASLAQTRDLLLPKLMSGKIRVGDADKFVQESP